MWPLGHAAIAYLCYTAATRVRLERPPAAIPVAIVLFGSQFPDLVDKPLAWYLGVLPTGRTLAHSLLLLVPLSVLVYAIAVRAEKPEYGIAFAIGVLSHALVDTIPALWGGTDPSFLLWPLVPVEPYENGAPTVFGLLLDSLGDPYFLSEFLFAALALVMWRRDGCPGTELLETLRRRIHRRVDG
ncbi:metal-dependent hydrolase [Natrarchaeobius oligotrophus]|uniref:Metal-dependent hydrolase n=1 Tax=Natrarchaeobius chitinivorans TaxID=1679083 RepID=A0A3N6PAN3_NATCH|nr:metal-dependent hydrolase [Natrarchaeobius chitinivorans]RQG96169.1 metal-dependent hydrolase [Natrarchaeobius chitinivorans]